MGWDGPFGDVYGCTLYYSAINWLHDEGFAEGVKAGPVSGNVSYTDGKRVYLPNRDINRAEFTKLVLLVAGEKAPLPACKTKPFPDVEVHAWYAPYICRAKEKGIISGFPDGTFKPHIPVNFANASKILVNSFGLPTRAADDRFSEEETIWFRKYTEALRRHDAIAPSVATFDANLTRGEMAEMLFRLKTGLTSFETERDEDSGNLGMGYGPYDLEIFGFTVDPPVPPYIFMPVSRSIASPIPFTADGYAFAYVLPEERCGASGYFMQCVPLLRNWEVSFFTTNVPASTIIAGMEKYYPEFPQTTHAFGMETGTCMEMGIEGENTRFCVASLEPKKSMIVIMDYIDGSFAFIDVPGILGKEDIENMFTRMMASIWFSGRN